MTTEDNPLIDEALDTARIFQEGGYIRFPELLKGLAEDLRFRYQQIREMAKKIDELTPKEPA